MSTNQWAVRALLCLRIVAIVGVAAIMGLVHFVITQLFTLYIIYSALLGLPLGYLIAILGPDCANRRQAVRLFCLTFVCSIIVLLVSNAAYFQAYYAVVSRRALYEQSSLPSNVFEFILFRVQNESWTLFSIDLSSLARAVGTVADVARGGTAINDAFSNVLYMGLELLLLWLFVSVPPLHRFQVALKTGVSYGTIMIVRDLMQTGRSESQIHEQLRKRGITTNDEIARAIRSVRIYETLKAQVPNSFLKKLIWR